MALKLLQPGIEPLGQFDLEDDDTALVVGGEVGIFEDLDEESDAYAADAFQVGPQVHISLGDVTAAGQLYGLVDEGTSGYGTYFGTVIGATAGQGTGFGTLSTTGVVTVGPSTLRGSGKATLWTKPGLYGVTSDAWAVSAEFDAAALNAALYGTAEDGTLDGKLSTTDIGGMSVALVLGTVADSSLVSTTTTAAGAVAASDEYMAIYLLGVQAA